MIIAAGLLGLMAARVWLRRNVDADDPVNPVEAFLRNAMLGRLGSGERYRQSAAHAALGRHIRDMFQSWLRAHNQSTRSVGLQEPLTALPINQPGPAARAPMHQVSQALGSRLVATPPLVSLPVASLAGLPVSRPVLDGWSGGRRRGKRVALRRAVRRTISGHCPACQQNRTLGRNYCVDCTRRLTPFLA